MKSAHRRLSRSAFAPAMVTGMRSRKCSGARRAGSRKQPGNFAPSHRRSKKKMVDGRAQPTKLNGNDFSRRSQIDLLDSSTPHSSTILMTSLNNVQMGMTRRRPICQGLQGSWLHEVAHKWSMGLSGVPESFRLYRARGRTLLRSLWSRMWPDRWLRALHLGLSRS